MRTLLIILLALALAQAALAAYCNGKPGQRYVNSEQIWNEQPRLLKKHQYGLLYEIGRDTTAMKLLHVYGSMYQMGLAQGVLLKEELNSFITELWNYILAQIEDGLPKKMPKFLQKGAATLAVGTVLDLNYQITLPFTNKKYYEEMQGIADGSGVQFKYLRRIHMIGELTKGACSMFGAWGKATSNGQTVQLRALDWVLLKLFVGFRWALPQVPFGSGVSPQQQKVRERLAEYRFYGMDRSAVGSE